MGTQAGVADKGQRAKKTVDPRTSQEGVGDKKRSGSTDSNVTQESGDSLPAKGKKKTSKPDSKTVGKKDDKKEDKKDDKKESKAAKSKATDSPPVDRIVLSPSVDLKRQKTS